MHLHEVFSTNQCPFFFLVCFSLRPLQSFSGGPNGSSPAPVEEAHPCLYPSRIRSCPTALTSGSIRLLGEAPVSTSPVIIPTILEDLPGNLSTLPSRNCVGRRDTSNPQLPQQPTPASKWTLEHHAREYEGGPGATACSDANDSQWLHGSLKDPSGCTAGLREAPRLGTQGKAAVRYAALLCTVNSNSLILLRGVLQIRR